MDHIRTLFWWNRTDNEAALLWHEAARHARVVTLDELGGSCRITVRPPGHSMASLLPPEISYLDHGHQPDLLAAGLRRMLGGARPLRVLVAGEVDSPPLFAAAVCAFDPDFVAAPRPLDPSVVGDPIRSWPSPGGVMSRAKAHRAMLEFWRRDFGERTRRRLGAIRRYRIDELLASGLSPPDPCAPLRATRVAPRRPATLLMPGCGGGATRLVLHLAAADVPPDGTWQLRMDGHDLIAHGRAGRIEAIASALPPAPCHVLDIANAGVRDMELVAVEIGPA